MALIIDVSVLRHDYLHTIEVRRLDDLAEGRDSYVYEVTIHPADARPTDGLPRVVGRIKHSHSAGALVLAHKALGLLISEGGGS